MTKRLENYGPITSLRPTDARLLHGDPLPPKARQASCPGCGTLFVPKDDPRCKTCVAAGVECPSLFDA